MHWFCCSCIHFVSTRKIVKNFGWKTRQNAVVLFSSYQIWFDEKNCQIIWLKIFVDFCRWLGTSESVLDERHVQAKWTGKEGLRASFHRPILVSFPLVAYRHGHFRHVALYWALLHDLLAKPRDQEEWKWLLCLDQSKHRQNHFEWWAERRNWRIPIAAVSWWLLQNQIVPIDVGIGVC